MNLRPSGYEPDELPNCSTPRKLDYKKYYITQKNFVQLFLKKIFKIFKKFFCVQKADNVLLYQYSN